MSPMKHFDTLFYEKMRSDPYLKNDLWWYADQLVHGYEVCVFVNHIQPMGSFRHHVQL